MLGQLSALTLGFAVHGGRAAFRRSAVRGAVIAASCLCLWRAHSGGGLISAAVLLAAPPLLAFGRSSARRMGGAYALLLGGAALATLALAVPLMAPALLSAIGKDPTLTGRQPLWALILPAARARPGLG